MKLTFPQFSAVIARVESSNDPEAWGDCGQACGRWQQHPSFVAQWCPSSTWTVHDTWDDVFKRALLHFYNHAFVLDIPDVNAAVGYHLHGRPDLGTPDDAPDYAARFIEDAKSLGFAL